MTGIAQLCALAGSAWGDGRGQPALIATAGYVLAQAAPVGLGARKVIGGRADRLPQLAFTELRSEYQEQQHEQKQAEQDNDDGDEPRPAGE